MHKPVLVKEVIKTLAPQIGDVVVDGTIGYGGHSTELLTQIESTGRLIGLDQDPVAIQFCQKVFSGISNVDLIQSNYSNLREVLRTLGVSSVDCILLDLGMSSVQLDQSNRGFTYLKTEPLDMRMNPGNQKTAETILNTFDKSELMQLFIEYGDIKYPEKLVDNIILQRPFKTTDDLINVIKKSFFFRQSRKRMLQIFAKVFQALRIEVNQELQHLTLLLNYILEMLSIGGRGAIITFHSIEDKLVKTFIKENKKQITLINKRVIQVSYADAKKNTRARSAKLRAFERIK